MKVDVASAKTTEVVVRHLEQVVGWREQFHEAPEPVEWS